ncbi:hypothetical protein QVZ41_13790 [Wenyingzhuangia sp. chi5]|uniref:Uncharacterized protein n=1 Tax=Wenyingzhuangia gilva TaxID=3057677 RepID=A0ABT8VVB8_9FLAO|nr:hypothetical protein [Wenyingzhuangia sp. chi5]MDO3695918.1 hypothetical protein [Wenyingzhuangia sp. chi5]
MLIQYLDKYEYDFVENVKTYETTKSRLNYSYRILRADLIFINNNIIVIPYNYHFGGLIKQYQPILQFRFNYENKKIEGIQFLMNVESIENINSNIILKSNKTNNFLNGNMEIKIDLSEKEINTETLIIDRNYIV